MPYLKKFILLQHIESANRTTSFVGLRRPILAYLKKNVAMVTSTVGTAKMNRVAITGWHAVWINSAVPTARGVLNPQKNAITSTTAATTPTNKTAVREANV